MAEKFFTKQRRDRIVYFFPFQLVLLHLKRNHFLLSFWLLLFLVTTRSFANKFGIPYLFLAPEYLGEVNVLAYAILGFSLGGFIMAFNIFSYITHSFRFPFLGTLSRPFYKFCINNFIIPVAFVITYIWCSSVFLYRVELRPAGEILRYMAAFLAGNGVFILLAFLYFFPTNKNIFKIMGLSEEEFEENLAKQRKKRRRQQEGFSSQSGKQKWPVETYLSHFFQISLARNVDHYDKATLRKVFFQNHVNASLFEFLVLLTFFIVGAFQYTEFFIIPAAASACFLFTVVLMVISIAMARLKGWTVTALIALVLALNFASARWDILNMRNYAYGLDYEVPPVPYAPTLSDTLETREKKVQDDLRHHEAILDAWLARERELRRDPFFKPKFVVMNVSGGGLRSALWAVRTLQHCDSTLDGRLMRNTRVISGASGGIIGASYYRELYLRRDTLQPGLYSDVYLERISADLLNRVLFSFATNDIFIRFRTREIAGHKYILDRGMTFEDQLNKNTGFVLDKTIGDYAAPVERGDIPMMIMAPTVVSDGRRLLISSQPMSFLTTENKVDKKRLNLGTENLDFAEMFADHGAQNLRFTTALRMNSTFPYILPNAGLPTEPDIEVMDAGLRDNYGMKITAEYLLQLRPWIEKNTSGVVVVQIRDTKKRMGATEEKKSILRRLINPIGTFYGNFFTDQDYNMDQLMLTTSKLFDVPFEQVTFEIRFGKKERLALSWHLTTLEKRRIIESIHAAHNRESLLRLENLLE